MTASHPKTLGRPGAVLVVAALGLAHQAALAAPRNRPTEGLRAWAGSGSKSSRTPAKRVRPRGPLAVGEWEGGSCVLESGGRLVYTYGSGPRREVRVHDFGDEEAIKKVLALRCGRRSSGLLTTTHYLGFPGAEEVYRTGLARPAGHEPPPAQARSGQPEPHKPATAEERDSLLRALQRQDGSAKIVSVGFLMSKIAVVEEWGVLVGWTLTSNGPVVLHSDGTLAALVSTGDSHAWRGWQLVKRGRPGTQIRRHRGLTIVAVPGSDVLKVARLPLISGESCRIADQPLGSRLSAAPVLRQEGHALYLVSAGAPREIRVTPWGQLWGISVEAEEQARCRQKREAILGQLAPGIPGKAGAGGAVNGLSSCSDAAQDLAVLGGIYWVRGEKQLARLLWVRASATDPRAVLPMVLGFLKARDEAALERFAVELLQRPGPVRALAVQTAEALAGRTSHAAAAAVVTRAMKRSKQRRHRATLAAAAAWQQYRAGDFAAATSLARRALHLAPRSTQAAHVHALAHLAAGRLQLAESLFRGLARRSPSSHHARLGYALALALRGKQGRARREYSAAKAVEWSVTDLDYLRLELGLSASLLEAADELRNRQAEQNEQAKSKE